MNHTLEIINLSNNQIGNNGAVSFTRVLLNPDCSLKYLYLNHNNLTDGAGIQYINFLTSISKVTFVAHLFYPLDCVLTDFLLLFIAKSCCLTAQILIKFYCFLPLVS